MRGHIRLRAERAPYRRHGVVWTGERQIEKPIGELTGEQLLALTRDPAVRLEGWSEADGRYMPLPIDDSLTADDLQVAIDFYAQRAEQEVQPETPMDEGQAAAELARQLDQTGRHLAALRVEHANEREQLQDRIAALEAELVAGSNERQALQDRVAELEAELIAAKAKKSAAPRKSAGAE